MDLGYVLLIAAFVVVFAFVTLDTLVGRAASVSPRFAGWFMRRFPKLGRILINPRDKWTL